MPETNKTTDKAVVEPATDRIQMLSVSKDGTPDQAPNFEFIGDKDATLEATKEQFAQRAASAVDEQKRPELGLAPAAAEVAEDKSIAELKAAQDKAIAAAEKQAESIVNANTPKG